MNNLTNEQRERKRASDRARILTPEQKERKRERSRETMRRLRGWPKPKKDRFPLEKIWAAYMAAYQSEILVLGRDAWAKHPLALKWGNLRYYYKNIDKNREYYREKARRQFRKMKAENGTAYRVRLKRRQDFRKSHPDIEAKYRSKYTQSDKHTIWKYRGKLGFSSTEEIPQEMVEIMRLQRKINQEISKQQWANVAKNNVIKNECNPVEN